MTQLLMGQYIMSLIVFSLEVFYRYPQLDFTLNLRPNRTLMPDSTADVVHVLEVLLSRSL